MKRHDGDRALLFENVIGSSVPVLGNFLASPRQRRSRVRHRPIRRPRRRCCGTHRPDRASRWSTTRRARLSASIATSTRDRCFRCCATRPATVGRFVTAGVVIVRDPEYRRSQRLVPSHAAARRQPHGHQARLRSPSPRRRTSGRSRAGVDLPIVVCIGRDLSLCTPPPSWARRCPKNADELDGCRRHSGLAAGGGTGALTSDLPRARRMRDRPRGAHLADRDDGRRTVRRVRRLRQSLDAAAPIVTVDAVTHRPDPIYHAISGAGRETVMLRKYVLEASALARHAGGGADRDRRQPHRRRSAPLPRSSCRSPSAARSTTGCNATRCSRPSPR